MMVLGHSTEQLALSYAEVRPLPGAGVVATGAPLDAPTLRAPATAAAPVPRLRPERDTSSRAASLGAWQRWLDGLPAQLGGVPTVVVRRLWVDLLASAGVPLQPPAAGPGGELGFHLAWHRDEVYIDIDLGPDGRFEWFWVNRRTGEAAGSEDERLRAPPEALVARLVRDFHLK